MSYPRVQQYRRLRVSVTSTAGSAGTLAMALVWIACGDLLASLVMLAVSAALAIRARRWLRLAGRSGIGAGSEQQVREALAALARDGWRVRHSVALPWGGDIDHLVRCPSGAGFAVETKTRTFNDEQLQRTIRAARWAAGRRREYPLGVVPVVCVVRSGRLEHQYGEVLVVSLDRLLLALRSAATRRL